MLTMSLEDFSDGCDSGSINFGLSKSSYGARKAAAHEVVMQLRVIKFGNDVED